MSGQKFDGSKNRLDLLPPGPLQDIGWILTYGAQKYAPRNWEEGIEWGRVYGAALRHLFAFWGGEDSDSESGLPHLAHAACCIIFLLEFQKTHPELDDRPPRLNISR